MFVDQLLLVDVSSQLYYLTDAKKQNSNVGLTVINRSNQAKSWKIDNIDLTQQLSLSIFTDFRYQSIKITWLLSIFIDTDFYRLTTPGYLEPLKTLIVIQLEFFSEQRALSLVTLRSHDI